MGYTVVEKGCFAGICRSIVMLPSLSGRHSEKRDCSDNTPQGHCFSAIIVHIVSEVKSECMFWLCRSVGWDTALRKTQILPALALNSV